MQGCRVEEEGERQRYHMFRNLRLVYSRGSERLEE